MTEIPYFATRYQRVLRKNTCIHTLSVIVMLLLFTLSITPKRFLHDALAHHQDTFTYASDDGHDQFSKDGFNCDTHHTVAETPYTGDTATVGVEAPLLFNTSFATLLPAVLHLQPVPVTDLRGPPAIG